MKYTYHHLSIHLSTSSVNHPSVHPPIPTYIYHHLSIRTPKSLYLWKINSDFSIFSFQNRVFFFLPDSQGLPTLMAPRVVLVDPGDGAGAVDLHAPRAGAGSRGVAALLQPHHLGGRGDGGFGDWEDRPGHFWHEDECEKMNIVKYIDILYMQIHIHIHIHIYIYIYMLYTQTCSESILSYLILFYLI